MNKRARRRLRNKLFEQQEGRCFYCDGEMQYLPHGPLGATLDHVIPKAAGGPDNRINAVAAHSACNRSKADRHPSAEELERLIRQKAKEFA